MQYEYDAILGSQGEGGGQYNAPAARGSDFGASSPNESQGGGGFSRDLDDEIPF